VRKIARLPFVSTELTVRQGLLTIGSKECLMPARQCPFCGKVISDLHSDCPFCHETVPQVPGSPAAAKVPASPAASGAGNRNIRRGLLYMLLAAATQYVVARYGSSILKVPVKVEPIVTSYLVPFLFLCGLGLMVYGFFLHAKPSA
jgi:hypothetical protein